MRRLPAHHVSRPRLTDRCMEQHVVVVEASGGFGKSVFAAELVDALGTVGVEVALHEGGMQSEVFVSRLLAAVAEAGFTSAAEEAGGDLEDPVGAIDAVLRALRDESCAFVVDDAHFATREVAVLIDRMASHVDGEQRLVVLARRLPEGSERLRRAEAVHLTATDLALTPSETLQLCTSGFGLDVGEDAARALDVATSGWTAATVLAAARAKRTGESLLEVADRAAQAARGGALAAILDEAIVTLGAGRRSALAQLARLPLLNQELVDAALGHGFFDVALASGVPLYGIDDGWWDLAGPVREFLSTLGDPDVEVLRRAAAHYRSIGMLEVALDLLLAAGDERSAASSLCTGNLREVDAMDVREYRAFVARLSADAVAEAPIVLVLLSRFLDAAGMFEERAGVLDRIDALVNDGTADREPLARALAAERCTDLVRAGEFAEAEAGARSLLAQVPSDEVLTRARLLSCIGRCLCWHFDDEGRRDALSLREADARLAEAASLYLRIGMRAASAGMAPYRAMWIEHARGNAAGALLQLDEAIEQLTDRPRRYAYLLTMRTEVLLELGRHDEAWNSIEEVLRIAGQLGDDQMVAYAHWNAMTAASHAGDAAAAVEHARVVEAHKGDWWEAAGPDFCSHAADDLARVGEIALAAGYLEQAAARPGDAGALVALAGASMLARHGDPAAAEAALLAVPGTGIDPREYWRIELLRAYAALRRGDPTAGSIAAHAFEEAARLGLAHLPLTKERGLTEALVELASETGQPAARALKVATLPLVLSVLGRFELTSGGQRVELSATLGTKLLKLVAVSGGRTPVDRAIEDLWPEADVDAGRNRLRTILNRLRIEAGDVLERHGEALVLNEGVAIDLARFHDAARQALALGRREPTAAGAVARAAIARYRGELLPDDPYEPWAAEPRDRARRTAIELLELCMDVASARGDLDGARWAIERAIDLAPDDDRWYARAAETLVAQGRRGAAVAVLRRAHREFRAQGFELPAGLAELERSLVGASG